ncbi:MAG TPA: hypothetical protein VHM19_08625 [Polyangiales bacterium]|nr:hypothetical protein [Polyangiales bacterium]
MADDVGNVRGAAGASADDSANGDGAAGGGGTAGAAGGAHEQTDAAMPEPKPTETQRVLFVGNSYTSFNDLPGLYNTLATSSEQYASVETFGVMPGGWTLAQHAADADTEGKPLHDQLAEGAKWKFVVLQDQSEIPAFGPDHLGEMMSRDGAVKLAEHASMLGAHTVLYMTWGRRDGDSQNMELLPDFQTMQDKLEAGYRDYAKAIRDAGYDVTIAPVGLAFAAIHDDGTNAKVQFASLYADDGSHPSPAGSYLAACVLFGTIAGLDALDAVAAPAGMPAADMQYLVSVAKQAVDAEAHRK